jgi:hypothetical protein
MRFCWRQMASFSLEGIWELTFLLKRSTCNAFGLKVYSFVVLCLESLENFFSRDISFFGHVSRVDNLLENFVVLKSFGSVFRSFCFKKLLYINVIWLESL